MERNVALARIRSLETAAEEMSICQAAKIVWKKIVARIRCW